MTRIALLTILTVLPAASGAAQTADTASITAIRQAFVAAVRSKDAAALGRLTTADVVMIRGRSGQIPPVVGQAAFQGVWTDAFARMPGANPYALHPRHVAIGGSVATEAGEFGPEGAPAMGHYVFLYDLTAEGWRIAYWKFFRSP